LLLISSDFLASDYCYSFELKRALERHASQEACVIPVILRSCDWKNTGFGKLQVLPTDGKAIKSWSDLDEAFTDVVRGLRRSITELTSVPAVPPALPVREPQEPNKPLLKPFNFELFQQQPRALPASGERREECV
jgi:hypothetical protein